ncbi:hypothetical protein HJ588_04550 [Flexivirga sp. ID2601S]|uniref:Uncharacterized protein n=1 Tax=Flexivirga aerilata TaxID=1656889 RepID=A0A849AG47_9MICO|nr:hypothetical protein [Flexivirga aerilata]NNG38546.1 hypothetical protein [Flexivirga aerilata]
MSLIGQPRIRRMVVHRGRVVLDWPDGATARTGQDLVDRTAPFTTHRAPREHDTILRQLADTVGGAATLDQLPGRPLTALPPAPAEVAGAAALLADVAGVWFPDEAAIALRTGLVLAVRRDPALVTDYSPELLAASTCWAVGHANGLLGPRRAATQRDVLGRLGIDGYVSQQGHRVAAAVRPFGMPEPLSPWSTFGRPEQSVLRLLRLGRPGLLVSSVRHQLIELRDQARAERARFLG